MQKVTGGGAESGDQIAVTIVSFGNDPRPLLLKKGATVREALEAASITRGTQELFVSGEVANDHDILEAGDVLSIVAPKQAGA